MENPALIGGRLARVEKESFLHCRDVSSNMRDMMRVSYAF